MKHLFQNKSLRFFLILSLSSHLFIGLIFILSKGLFFKNKKSFLIENSIQISQLELSENTKKPEIPKKKIAKKAPKKKIKTAQKKEIKKPKSKLLKNEEQKTSPQKIESKKEMKNSFETESKNSKLEENNTTEKKEDSESTKFNSQKILQAYLYGNEIRNQITENWKIPAYFKNQNFTTEVEIQINSNGKIIYKQIIKSSGNDLYDSFVLKTIDINKQYSKPSPSTQKIIQEGIVLKFPNQDI